ncbi:MAG: hypothetical protein IKG27_00280 [Bacilli bacterium]|nr:hypothetical protein [Bacilli bacterium]
MEMIMFFKILCLILVVDLALAIVFLKMFEFIFGKIEEEPEKLREKFYKKLEIANSQESDEILECLIDMEELNKTYKQIAELDDEFMDDISYLRLKESALSKIIDKKIESIKGQKKKERLKALLEEIEICRKRYPEYNEIFVEKTNMIKEKLN